ncbi:hypothetical protein AAFF_G00194860 [Aldrovandia affinis]|uniref:Uncharacterized protein n=1 Tax=Aldrovandia affinis TaxID=143900 RepID=A0AAD7SXG6_9TELE|nr:hypothetical protein AAFF_G00194860 [Aldrovandia affinis]
MLSRKGNAFVPSPPVTLSARDGGVGGRMDMGGRGSTQKAVRESAQPWEWSSHRNSFKQPGMAFPCPPTLDGLLAQHWKDLQEGFSDSEELNKVLEFQSDELQWTSKRCGTSAYESQGLGEGGVVVS